MSSLNTSQLNALLKIMSETLSEFCAKTTRLREGREPTLFEDTQIQTIITFMYQRMDVIADEISTLQMATEDARS